MIAGTVSADGWFSAHAIKAPWCIGVHAGLCPRKENEFTFKFCYVHPEMQLMDANGEGDRFTRPTCLICLSQGTREARLKKVKPHALTFDPYRSLHGMLVRYLVANGKKERALRGYSIEQLARMIGPTADVVWRTLGEFEPPKSKRRKNLSGEGPERCKPYI